MRTVAAIQARCTSTRLPGKVMKEVLGEPLLGHLLTRLRESKHLDEIAVSTPVLPENDPIAELCAQMGIPCFRGSEGDVLGRMLGCLKKQNADTGVVVFGDCPLIDPLIVDEMIAAFRADDELDFLGNDLKTTYPPGMDVEVFRVAALSDSSRRTTDAEIREHGTLYLRLHPEIYRIKNVEAPEHLRRPDLLLGLDTPEDLEVITAIFQHFGRSANFGLVEMIDFLDGHPELKEKNEKVFRRWRQYRQDN